MLICCHHTLRDVTFEERVAAAASAGYDAIGINLGAYRQLADEGRTDEELAEVLAAHGQRVHEIEALRNWSHDGEAKERSDALRELAFHIADTFGATYLQAVGPYEGDLAHAAASFAELCDRAADHGMVVGLEFLPSISNIPDVATGRALVEAAGRPNGGLCVDSWHFTRGNPDWDALGDLPGELVKGIQINDGTIEPEAPDYQHDGIANRRQCG
ncbi:MAG: sugar phosphate isomerase/epimerase family protein, partial [Acidimicrobiia bacterium]